MKEITKDQVCERADDLVGFLYGELTDWEARKFERHMQDCAACTTEYAAFGQLRESIVAWRNEALGLGGERVFVPAVPPIQPRRASALAALREFFNLSPLWMKGVAAFASVLFCVFATLAIAHLIEKKNGSEVRASGERTYSLQEMNAEIDKRVREKLASIEVRKDQTSASVVNSAQSPQKQVKRYVATGTTGLANNSQRLRRPLSRQERQ